MNVGDRYTDVDGEWEVLGARNGVVTSSRLLTPSAEFERARREVETPTPPPSLAERHALLASALEVVGEDPALSGTTKQALGEAVSVLRAGR